MYFTVELCRCFCFEVAEKAESKRSNLLKMPELKRPLESSDSTALVLAKKPRNELVEVTDKSKALVQSVSLDHRSLIEYRIGFYKRSFAERPRKLLFLR